MPWRPRSPDETFELLNRSAGSLTRTVGGVYVLYASREGLVFQYPLGPSAVYYIGLADAGSGRLAEHRRHIRRAAADAGSNSKFTQYWWPRYAFGATAGARVEWFSCQGAETPATLESDLIDAFYWMYGCKPLANGAWS